MKELQSRFGEWVLGVPLDVTESNSIAEGFTSIFQPGGVWIWSW